MAGDGELDAAGEWIASAPEEVLLRLGAPRDRSGRARRPDATTLGRVLTAVDQCQYDDSCHKRDRQGSVKAAHVPDVALSGRRLCLRGPGYG
jgi:hypothetical protein